MYSFYYRVRKNERARGGVQQAELYYYIVYKITLDCASPRSGSANTMDLHASSVQTKLLIWEKLVIIERT